MISLHGHKCPLHDEVFTAVGRARNPDDQVVHIYFLASCKCKFAGTITAEAVDAGEFDMVEISAIKRVNPQTGKAIH